MAKLCDELRCCTTEPEAWEKWNRRVFGDQGTPGMFHYTGFSHPYLGQILENEYGMSIDEVIRENYNVAYKAHKVR